MLRIETDTEMELEEILIHTWMVRGIGAERYFDHPLSSPPFLRCAVPLECTPTKEERKDLSALPQTLLLTFVTAEIYSG